MKFLEKDIERAISLKKAAERVANLAKKTDYLYQGGIYVGFLEGYIHALNGPFYLVYEGWHDEREDLFITDSKRKAINYVKKYNRVMKKVRKHYASSDEHYEAHWRILIKQGYKAGYKKIEFR